ncbi:MAG: hypothetical protein MZU97_18210 [Bacillus subtilis]|nr:hypothetical protein [Bacillus subtilis]
MAMAAGFNNVFEIGPVFRAENSHTAYHATEFTSVDIEISWVHSHHDVMDQEEIMCRNMIQEAEGDHRARIHPPLRQSRSMTCCRHSRAFRSAEAKRIVKENYKYSGEKEHDFDRREEELICMYVKKQFKSDFVFIIDYPFAARPFYHMLDETTGLTKIVRPAVPRRRNHDRRAARTPSSRPSKSKPSRKACRWNRSTSI